MTVQSLEKLLKSVLPNGQTNSTKSSDLVSSDDSKRIIEWTNEAYKRIRSHRASIENQWYYDMAFYFGKQYVAFRSAGNTIIGPGSGLYTPKAPSWRARPVINRIRPIMRKEMSKLLSQKPTAFVVPASSEDEDFHAANAAGQIWESTYHRKKVKATLRKAVWWQTITGNGFVKCFWDEEAIDTETEAQGDISIYSVTPFHFLVPDFREEELEDQPFVLQAQLKHVDAVRIAYPDANFEPIAKSANEIIDSTWLNLHGVSGIMDNSYVLCLEGWIKPNQVRLFPDGAFITVIGDRLAQFVPGFIYEHGMYPYSKLEHIPSGKFYADSVITDLVSLQKEFNRRRGQIQEAANRMAKPQLLVEKGSVDVKKITSEPGLAIPYKVGMNKPEPLPLQNLPPYIFEELDRMVLDMSDISAQHEVSRGQVPPNVGAATAISFLQEQDDTMLSFSYDSIEEGIEKIARMALYYVHQFWDYPRTVKVVGADGAFDVMAFKGSDLRGNTDIRVEAGSSLPTSKAARQAFVMDMMDRGYINPNEGLEVLGIGGIQNIYERIRVDKSQVQRENIRMAAVKPELLQQFLSAQQQEITTNPQKFFDPVTGWKGMTSPTGEPRPPLIVPVNEWDNHAIHIEVHNSYRKGQKFDQLSDDAKQLFDQHVRFHSEQLAILNMASIMTGFDPEKKVIPSGEGSSELPGPAPLPESQPSESENLNVQ